MEANGVSLEMIQETGHSLLNQPGHTVSPWLVWGEMNVLNRWAFTLPYMEGALWGWGGGKLPFLP